MAITCKFLSEEFYFHDDLLVYLDALEIADEIQSALFNIFKRKVNASDVKVIDSGMLKDAMMEQASHFIRKLCSYDIYDKTIDEYVFENEGYNMFCDVNDKALKAMSSFLLTEMKNLQQGMERAEVNAAANITGTGVQVWSDSFLTLSAFSAYEYSVLKKQAKKADQQYRSEIQLAINEGSDKRAEQEINYLNNIYFPDMTKALTLFAYCMLDRYLSDLNKSNLFDNETLNYVNVKRSQDLLKNLNLSPDKKKVLISAFRCCPFNVGIFFEAEKYGLVGIDEIETLKTLKQLDEFYGEMKRRFAAFKMSSNLNVDIDSMQPLVRILCLCSGNEPIFYYMRFTNTLYQDIVNEYKGIQKLIETPSDCQKILDEFGTKILTTTENDLLQKAKDKVCFIASSSMIETLKNRCGYPDILKEIAPNSEFAASLTSKSEIDDYYVSTLSRYLSSHLNEKQHEVQQQLDADAKNKHRFNTKLKQRKLIASIILAIFLVLPPVVQIKLASTWVNSVNNYLENMISENIRNKLQNERSYFNEAGLNSDFEITSIKYYKESIGIFYIVPEVKYSSNQNNLPKATASLAIFDLDKDHKNSLSVPFCVAWEDAGNVWIMSNSTVIQDNGEQIHCNHFTDYFDNHSNRYNHSEHSRSVNPYLPGGFIVFYVIYAAVLLIVFHTNKKKDFGLFKSQTEKIGF